MMTMMVVEWVMMIVVMIGRVDGWAMMQQGLPEEEPKCAASILPAPLPQLSRTRAGYRLFHNRSDQLGLTNFFDQLGLTNFFPTNLV